MISIQRDDTPGDRGLIANIYGYDVELDSLYHIQIPKDSIYSDASIFASTRNYFFFGDGPEPVYRYDRQGRYRGGFDPNVGLLDLNRGIGYIDGRTLMAWFDSSLYFFARVTRHDRFVPDGSVNVTGTMMSITRFSADFELLDRTFTDIVHTPERRIRGFLPVYNNQGIAVSPDGQRMFAVSWYPTDTDSIYWHVYRFAKGGQQLPTLELQFSEFDSLGVFGPDGVVATRDGGAVVYGSNIHGQLRFYRIAPDSAYVPVSTLESTSGPSAASVPFAYPNPVGAYGPVWIDGARLPESARTVQAVSVLGQAYPPVRLAAGGARTALALPEGAGACVLVIRDAGGAIIARQVVVRGQ